MAGNNSFFTHEVSNQPPALENYNLFQTDIPLQQAFKRYAPTEISALFCASRLGPDGGKCYGILPAGAPLRMIIDRAYAGNHSSL